MEKILLSDGRKIPCMGFGCYNAFGEEMSQAIRWALEAGYRYIDSAEFYGNEEAVGAGLAACRELREETFVLSKAWPSSYEDIKAALGRTLKHLQVEYLDAYLLHWPGTDEKRRLTAYEQLLSLQEKGLVRTVGVSNFQPEQLDVIKREFGAYPAINELETHPSYQQQELVGWCMQRGIQTIAYSPINRSNDLQNDTVRGLAEKYNRTPAQIVLRWHLEKQHIPIPKSSNRERIHENIGVFDFSLTKEETAAIDALECGAKSGQDPYHFPAGF